jgi:hypothetical protein
MSSARPAITLLPDAQPPSPPAPRLAQRLRRHVASRMAALSLVGAMMVGLPLVQVLRFQADQIDQLIHHQRALNPMVRAVQVQRGVMLHRDLAKQVLQGQDAVEAQRLTQQRAVSLSTAALTQELQDAHWPAAHQEALALQEDFALLVPKIVGHQISADDSDQLHRLLVEQTLQVMDLVQDTQGERSTIVDSLTGAALAQAQALPRQAWLFAQALPESKAPEATSASASVLAPAAASSAVSTTASESAPASTPVVTPGAWVTAAVQAHWRQFDKAHASASLGVNKTLVDAQRQRTRTLAMLGALATLALGLLIQLWRSLSRTPPTPESGQVRQTERSPESAFFDTVQAGPAAAVSVSPSAESQRLLDRLLRRRQAKDRELG